MAFNHLNYRFSFGEFLSKNVIFVYFPYTRY